MEKKKFNQLEYTKEYNKTHYRRINLSVKPDEYDEIKKICKENNINCIDIFKKGFEIMKSENE